MSGMNTLYLYVGIDVVDFCWMKTGNSNEGD